MVLYATRPKTLSPADPCNKVAVNCCWLSRTVAGNREIQATMNNNQHPPNAPMINTTLMAHAPCNIN
jgi:hypothetical protein